MRPNSILRLRQRPILEVLEDRQLLASTITNNLLPRLPAPAAPVAKTSPLRAPLQTIVSPAVVVASTSAGLGKGDYLGSTPPRPPAGIVTPPALLSKNLYLGPHQ